MQRLILFILLITWVYSWEEFKYLLVALWSKIWKQKVSFEQNSQNDQVVADIVVLATIPLSLAYLLFAPGDLTKKLIVILAEIIIVSLLLKGIAEYSWRRNFTKHYEGSDRIVAGIFSLLGLVSPSWNFATKTFHSRSFIGKYLLSIIIPLIIGFGLTKAGRNSGVEGIQSQLDTLIVIATLGLIMNAVIEILEHAFRLYRLHLFSLMRIALGIVIIFALQQNL